MNFYISLFLKGMAMGAANVIPGVSGGTIAFITGIYERFINALKSFDLKALRLLIRFDLQSLARQVDIYFLLAVGGGIVLSILSLAKVLEFLFVNYEQLTLAFFFGLIVASVVFVANGVDRWSAEVILLLLIGVAVAISIAFMVPASANDNFFYIFLCGIVAVCSMILPGLSGSYILLLMGNYVLVLKAISSFNFGIIIPLILGCAIGLVLFSRVLSYLFAHYKDHTIALLSGFVIGSLLIIWPWKETQYEELSGKLKATGYSWYWPELGIELFYAIILIVLGFLTVYLMEKSARRAEASEKLD